MKEKKHIFIGKNGKLKKYTSRRTGGSEPNIPECNRNEHGDQLLRQINLLKSEEACLINEAQEYEFDSVVGVQISFESYPGVELSFEKLADVRSGIELLNVIQIDNKYVATILVPIGKFYVLEKKIEEYLDPEKDGRKHPKHSQLLNTIATIRKTVIENLWTDSPDLYPQSPDTAQWLEIWLPVSTDRQAIVSDFKKLCSVQNIEVSQSTLEFPERIIVLVKASLKQLSQSALLLSKIAEIKKSKTTADFFEQLPILDQFEWCNDLLGRTTFISGNDCPYISIMDTGINSSHPLLQQVCNENDLFVIEPNWDPADSDGHGTSMAGIAAFGDLSLILDSQNQIEIKHRIESIKLLRYSGDNEGKHLGQLTADGISLSEIAHFDRKRIYALALSSKDSMDRGKPSAWSSELDSLSVDYLGENLYRRLFVVCAGNIGNDLTALREYPQYNELQDIHDPGQSWNVLTIGAYTNKIDILDEGGDAYTALAPSGGLSPYSTTSVTWISSMPIKPEVVFEGGNMGIDSYSAASMSNLQLLTTDHDIPTRLFSTFNATSAAAALAAKFAAEIYSEYPNLWPETVRALIVHSAQWTESMKAQFNYSNKTERKNAEHLVRVVGYGVPDMKKALWSMNNSLVMIVEDELQPFEAVRGKSDIATKDMHIHELPWPKEQLLELGDSQVKMTVTLSYFIEPNPSSRNVANKYHYPSHQLKFDVKRPTESSTQFLQRLSRNADNEAKNVSKPPKDLNWLLGNFRNKGSIHKDVWTGSAAELAERGILAVYPATGWWRTRKKLGKYNKMARYALIVSIETASTDIDLYTPIQNQVDHKNILAIEINITNNFY
ncbi:S8 family peptidase [Xenorhabdus sp. VLS]|uniref:S8 family peptidase n=1 Tax=Xenorhabdus lircayensis TaxID=2763499 RepID=A0ABS0U8W1_9GAMM|nr:S8 family peptidase [Xenorhabdus lircayensis]